MLLNLSRNTPLVKLVLLRTTGVSQPRRVEDAKLQKGLCIFTTLINFGTYHYAVLTPEFVKAG